MNVFEIVLLAIGAVATLGTYFYSKFITRGKKAKIPDNYTEVIGICKKHHEKNDKFYAEYEVVYDGKTLKYKSQEKDKKEELPEIDSILKLYINKEKTNEIKADSDFGSSDKRELTDKQKKLCYGIMGTGLACIILTLILILF